MSNNKKTKNRTKKPLLQIFLGITIFFLISGSVFLIIGFFAPFAFPTEGTTAFNVSQAISETGLSLFDKNLREVFDILVRFGSSTNSLLLLDTALGGFSFIIIGMIFSIPTFVFLFRSVILKKRAKKDTQKRV